MLKVSDITRTYDMWDRLVEDDEEYAYIDYPCNTRYIFWAGLVDLGYYRIYKTDPNNQAIEYSDVIIGHQDTVRALIQRANNHAVSFDAPLDLSHLTC